MAPARTIPKAPFKAPVRHFWQTRADQKASGRRDQGSRSAVTGGKQMDGFVDVLQAAILATGIPGECIFTARDKELPGYFRSSKQWDMVVVKDNALIAAIELKSHVGSFGNNANNRAEEAVGSATDFWTAYREGAFLTSPQP